MGQFIGKIGFPVIFPVPAHHLPVQGLGVHLNQAAASTGYIRKTVTGKPGPKLPGTA
jgi:hypothetical protein